MFEAELLHSQYKYRTKRNLFLSILIFLIAFAAMFIYEYLVRALTKAQYKQIRPIVLLLHFGGLFLSVWMSFHVLYKSARLFISSKRYLNILSIIICLVALALSVSELLARWHKTI